MYDLFADVLALCQSSKDNLEAILDPNTGFAPRIRDICRAKIEEYQVEVGLVSPEELESLRLEANTWALLQSVMPARKMEFLPDTLTARELLQTNPYTPTSTIAQAIMNASPLLTELVVIREWLQDTAPLPQLPEATTGYWKFTRHSVQQVQRSGVERDGLVKNMDPDAVNRGDGRALAADDASSEKNLLQALYAYVRAGRLDDALELCRRAHQPWRSASIRGSFLFRWKSISNEPTSQQDEDAMDQDMEEEYRGNFRRTQWKNACIRAALCPNMSDSERILYAALAPSPQTSAILKMGCRTWEDYLWAQISIMCEEKQSAEMTKIGGSFWGAIGLGDGMESVKEGIHPCSREDEEREEEEWEREVVSALQNLAEVHVEDGLPADHPFHYSQLQIILDRSTSLLETYANGLREGQFDGSLEYANMCRFFAHLSLYLQMIDISVPPLATQTILEAYLQVLEDAGQRDLIALYASALGDNAVERYALFLVSLEISSDHAERRAALVRAREHGLDVLRVANVAAERSVEKAFNELPDPLETTDGQILELPNVIQMPKEPTKEEKMLLRSIEWTTFFEETYGTALEQACVVLRYFLAVGRIDLAQSLLPSLPTELASIKTPEHLVGEYVHYRSFFHLWGLLSKVDQVKARSVAGVVGVNSKIEEYNSLVEQVREAGIKLLTSDWLSTDLEIGGERRKEQLLRIRAIFVPELVLRLHFVLADSGDLKRTLELVNIVADSRYRLYDDFGYSSERADAGRTRPNGGGKKLGDYIGVVRKALLKGVEGGGSDVFRVLM